MASTVRRRALIGSKIGNYSLVSELGEGGMGIVYLAEHQQIGKRVAVKILHADVAAREDATARCFLEARAVNEIRHPNVVDIIDCGVAELGEHGPVQYLLMEYLDGEPLRALIKRGPIAPERAVAIALAVAKALAAAHAKGIVHRDIKPENIFLVGDGVKVLDFGIAKLMDERVFGDRLTKSGVTLGTPQYMAPEQLDNEDIDGRVDVYALAIVMFEMLTGGAPYSDETTARGVWRRMNEVPAIPPELAKELPQGLADVITRSLDPDRVKRPDIDELVRLLENPSTAEPYTVRMSKPKVQPRRSRFRWWMLAPLPIAGALIAIVAMRRDDKPAEKPVVVEVDAAPAPPKPIEPAAKPDVVTVRVGSKPDGAEVFVGSETAPRGVTPLAVVLPRGNDAVEIRIVKYGYLDKHVSVARLVDDSIEPTLAPDRKTTIKRPIVKEPPPPAPPDAGVVATPAVPVDAAPKPIGGNFLEPKKK